MRSLSCSVGFSAEELKWTDNGEWGKWQRSVKATADMRSAQQILAFLFLLTLADLVKIKRAGSLSAFICGTKIFDRIESYFKN